MIETIFYKSPIGTIQISANDNAINCLTFVNTIKNGKKEADDLEFFNPNSPVLISCASQLDHYFSGNDLFFDLPILQKGTEFQQEVWNELTKIKPGTTISYLQLSKKLGNVKAIRAVGTANGKNNIAIIVPCHRVIGSNGDLVGYAADLWRKKWLLDHEAKYLNGVQRLFD
jgi:methylated-DNA-[protein]-cysteine S-methyltransferase